jgi:hypothetical protein
MKASDAFPSKYISAADLQGRDVPAKITHIASEEIGGKSKFICYFAGKKKGLVLNKTNWNSIVRISGQDDTDDWTGVEVCLFEAMVDFQGDIVPAVRVKAPPKRASVAAGNVSTAPERGEYQDERTPQAPARRAAEASTGDPRGDLDDEIPF